AAPNVRIVLDDDGEIVVSGPHFFAGYWSDDAATTATLTADGLRTGDVGAWTAAGTLTLVDRKRDFVITAGGKNVSPAQVENALRSSRSRRRARSSAGCWPSTIVRCSTPCTATPRSDGSPPSSRHWTPRSAHRRSSSWLDTWSSRCSSSRRSWRRRRRLMRTESG